MEDVKLYWIQRSSTVKIPIKYLRFTDSGMPSIIQPSSGEVFDIESASDLLCQAFISNPSGNFIIEFEGSDKFKFQVYWAHNGTTNALSDLSFDRIGIPTITLTDSAEELTLVEGCARLGFLAKKQPHCKFFIWASPKLICSIAISIDSPEVYAFFQDSSIRWYEDGSSYPANYKEIDSSTISTTTAGILLERCEGEYKQQVLKILTPSRNDFQ